MLQIFWEKYEEEFGKFLAGRGSTTLGDLAEFNRQFSERNGSAMEEAEKATDSIRWKEYRQTHSKEVAERNRLWWEKNPQKKREYYLRSKQKLGAKVEIVPKTD